MRGILFIALVLLGIQAGATTRIKWNKGCIVDTKGHVIGGEVSKQTNDMILFRSNDKVMAYNPHHIKSFSFYDDELKIARKFSATKESQKGPVFYELVVRGNVNIIRAERSVKVKVWNLPAISTEYLISWENKLTEISNFKQEVYQAMVKQCPLLEQFAKEQKLNPANPKDVFKIVSIFNKLSAPDDLIGAYSMITR